MKISVIVPAFNEEKLLASTLTAIRGAAEAYVRRGWDWELIVCDNNSTDGTAAIARAHGAKVVFEPVNQIGRARNSGAAAATGDWFLFIDADSQPSLELFDEAASAIAGGDVLFVGAVVELDMELGWVEGRLVKAWNSISRAFGWMAGSFMLVEAGAFRETGGFNPTLFAGEELDLSRRLKTVARRRGKRVMILHRHPLRTSARRMKLYSRGKILGFCARATLRPFRTIKSREACEMWYDGKR